MNKKITLIIGLQALIIITLFWVLVFYGQDEYEAYQSEQEEEIESQSKVTEKDGVNTVFLTPETQKNSGILFSQVKPSRFQGSVKTLGTVLTIDPLILAKTQYIALQSELQLAQTAHSVHIQQYQRLKTLNEDDKNVSDSVAQDAYALLQADQAKIAAISAQMNNLLASTQLTWGEALASLITGKPTASALQQLLTRQQVLVQISLPMDASSPSKGSVIDITPLNARTQTIRATYVSPATSADISALGRTYYFSAPAALLRTGMRVNVLQKNTQSSARNGVIVPSNAVVWHGGKPWVYIKQAHHQFVRKPINADTEVEDGWFVEDLPASSEVVTSGAQLLLSEEFKYLIKNENED